jgi:hypothetical protein
MRNVQKISSRPYWFVPDIDDNLEDPDPFRVRIRKLTLGEHSDAQMEAYSTGGNFALETQLYCIEKAVLSVEGYVVNGESVETGAKLAEALRCSPVSEAVVVSSLFNEIISASELDEETSKNSEGQPST